MYHIDRKIKIGYKIANFIQNKWNKLLRYFKLKEEDYYIQEPEYKEYYDNFK